jgi:hypothetical protein
MQMGLIFWILMLIWFVFALVTGVPSFGYGHLFGYNTVLIFILFLLLGWKVFGRPVQA